MSSPTNNVRPLAPIRRLGDFEIVRELGRGGMGVVYEARQVSLNRRVALKVLAGALGLTPTAVQRFRREAEAAARLHHTNVVPVYAIGEQDGVHFYAMELIDGPSLDAVIRDLRAGAVPDTPSDLAATGLYVPPAATPSPTGVNTAQAERFDRAAAMMADVADALHHAHQNGVTHRDVKPSNLLLSADGRLSVTDFGLARVLEQPGMTVTGEFVGTPLYVSPEQITAGRVPVDHRTDVYSLGATLYELLTLRPPFQADGRDRLLALITQKDPPAPRAVDGRIPRDLETICLKCLEKDPDRRYQSAKDLADDLRRFVHRFAIHAKRAGPIARTIKWAKRHPAVAVLLGGLFAALLAMGLFAYQAKRTQDAWRADQRDTALERAILAAMSHDHEAALEAIIKAENLGTPSGQLHLLRGLLELTGGRPRQALVSLKHADELLGGPVAVKALLAQATNDDGQWVEYEKRVDELTGAHPVSFEDHLFLALALAEVDPAKAVAILDETLTRRPAPVARLVRVAALSRLAQMTGRADDAERALADLDKLDLPDSMLYLNQRRLVLLAAAHNYGLNDPRAKKVLAEAAEVARALAKYSDQPMAVLGRCTYFFLTNQDDALLRELESAARRKVVHTYLDDYSTYAHYRRKEFALALSVAEQGLTADAKENAYNRLRQGVILAAMPGRKAEAEAVFAEAIRRYRQGPGLATMPAYWQLLGPEYRSRTRDASQDTIRHGPHLVPAWRDKWYHHLLAFHGETIDVETLMERAGTSQFNRCEASFYVGLRRLAEGKRSEAKEWFAKSVATGAHSCWEYLWSRAFLGCIDDPSWPPWLGKK